MWILAGKQIHSLRIQQAESHRQEVRKVLWQTQTCCFVFVIIWMIQELNIYTVSSQLYDSQEFILTVVSDLLCVVYQR